MTMKIGNLVVESDELLIKIPGTDLCKSITSREFQLLEYFEQRKNECLQLSNVVTDVWNEDTYWNRRIFEVLITRLRRILMQDSQYLMGIVKNEQNITFFVTAIPAEQLTA